MLPPMLTDCQGGESSIGYSLVLVCCSGFLLQGISSQAGWGCKTVKAPSLRPNPCALPPSLPPLLHTNLPPPPCSAHRSFSAVTTLSMRVLLGCW